MEILTVFDQTFIQPLEPRQHQSCQARGHVRSQCHGPADRDRAACVSWSGVRDDFSGTRNSRHEYVLARRWLRKARRIASDVVSGPKRASVRIESYRVIEASPRKAQPIAPNTKLTNQKRRFFVSAEIAAIAIAIWNIVTARAKTSCL